MAQADWDLTRGTLPTAILNSGLANPLPVGVGGNDCRFFTAADAGPTLRTNKPEFINIPSTKALRASMCFRRAAGFSNGNWAGFRLKGSAANYGTSGNGYGIAFRSGASGLPVLKLNNADELSLDGLPIASFYDSNWIRLRLDVFPIGLAADRLFVYRETVIGSGVWDAVGIGGNPPSEGFTILSNSRGLDNLLRYAPWGTGHVFLECTNFSGNAYYFDTFTLSVTDVP
jgi:hypothetical protein